ncbi:hypothetical protein EFM47_02000 [Streptococcus thermophilus]|nr:hypothetical protein [Streptococcus thermophilus]
MLPVMQGWTKKYVWIPRFYKIFTGFGVKVCQLDVCRKKLPSHDRLTASEGVEPSQATRIKNLKRQLRCYHLYSALDFKVTSLTLIMF